MSKHTELLPIIAGIVVSSIFGFSFFFTAEALDMVEPMQLLGYRFAIAALTLTILQLSGVIKINFRGKKLKTLMLLALFQPVVYFIFETIGVKMSSASEAGMIIATIPVIVTIFSVIFLKERPSIWQVGCVLLSVSGVVFIVFMKESGGGGNILGMLILFGAVLAAGVYNILSRKLSLSFKPVEITYVMMWTGAIAFNVIALSQKVLEGNVREYFNLLTNHQVLTSILYLGILSSIGAFFLLNYMLSKMEASRSAVFANLTTVIAIIAGVVFRGEPFYWFHIVGSVLILIGVYGTNYFNDISERKSPASVGGSINK